MKIVPTDFRGYNMPMLVALKLSRPPVKSQFSLGFVGLYLGIVLVTGGCAAGVPSGSSALTTTVPGWTPLQAPSSWPLMSEGETGEGELGEGEMGESTVEPTPPPSGASPRTATQERSSRNDYAPFVAMMVPGYTMRSNPPPSAFGLEDRGDVAHGLLFEIPFLARAGNYRHGFSVGYSDYFGLAEVFGRALYRLRLASPGDSAHWMAGVGCYVGSLEGFGTRVETGWLFGELGKGGLYVRTGFELDVDPVEPNFEFALGAFVPYVF